VIRPGNAGADQDVAGRPHALRHWALIIGNSTFSAPGSSFRLSILTGATPEPAAWALMMMGFGAVAWRMNARRPRRRDLIVA